MKALPASYISVSSDYNKSSSKDDTLFDNLPEILRPKVAADLLGISIKTVYDWRYRQKTRNIPDDLFIKFNRFLYVRTSALKKWMDQQNNILL